MSAPDSQPGPVELRVAGRGVTLRLPGNDDHLSRQLRSSGDFYERELLDDIVRRTEPGDTVVDVGANIGNHTVFLAASGLRVVALEPHPTLFEILDHNVTDNGLDGLVDLHPIAAGATRGTGSIVQRDPGNLGSSTVEPEGDGKVTIEALDDLLVDIEVACLKVDVEGGEAAVLDGARGTLERSRPVLYVELADAEAERCVVPTLEDLGYRSAGVFNATPTFVFVSPEDELEAIRSSLDGVARRLHLIERTTGTWRRQQDMSLRSIDSTLGQLTGRTGEHDPDVVRSSRTAAIDTERKRRREFEQQAADLRTRLTEAHELAAAQRSELIELRTALTRAEEKLEHQEAELEALRSWSGGLAHRVRTLLGRSDATG